MSSFLWRSLSTGLKLSYTLPSWQAGVYQGLQIRQTRHTYATLLFARAHERKQKLPQMRLATCAHNIPKRNTRKGKGRGRTRNHFLLPHLFSIFHYLLWHTLAWPTSQVGYLPWRWTSPKPPPPFPCLTPLSQPHACCMSRTNSPAHAPHVHKSCHPMYPYPATRSLKSFKPRVPRLYHFGCLLVCHAHTPHHVARYELPVF